MYIIRAGITKVYGERKLVRESGNQESMDKLHRLFSGPKQAPFRKCKTTCLDISKKYHARSLKWTFTE